jgi:hypothetical protein
MKSEKGGIEDSRRATMRAEDVLSISVDNAYTVWSSLVHLKVDQA